MNTATQNCEFCNSPAHIWFNCPKKPAGWKPDRLKKVASVAASTPAAGSPVGKLGASRRATRDGAIAITPKTDAASKATNPKAKASKANPRGSRPDKPDEADGDASRLSAGRTAQGAPVSAASAALAEQAIEQAKRRGRPISPNPKSKRAEYQRNLMRDKRAREAAARETK